MKLQDKIQYCRKKAGLSQEALAEKLGVSRQAVSKWETGDAVPEISKLMLLANAFGVTTDWLLSEEEPMGEAREPQPTPEKQPANTWVDSIPGVLGKLLRRYGWLFGVYTALVGAGFAGLGALARVLMRNMFSNTMSGFGDIFPGGGTIWYDEAGNVMSSPLGEQISSFAVNNPVYIIGTVIMIVGLVLLIGGIILAVCLKKRSNGK